MKPSYFNDPGPEAQIKAREIIDTMDVKDIPGYIITLMGLLSEKMGKIDSLDYEAGWGCAVAFLRLDLINEIGTHESISSLMSHSSGIRIVSAMAVKKMLQRNAAMKHSWEALKLAEQMTDERELLDMIRAGVKEAAKQEEVEHE